MSPRTALESTILTVAVLLLVALPLFQAAGQTSGTVSSTVTTFSTGTNIPAPTGCTAPGYAAPASLITTLGTAPAARETLKDAPMLDQILFFGGGLLTGLLILIGIIWAVAFAVTRGSRKRDASKGNARKSHVGRNAYLAIFLIAILVTGVGFYRIEPYLLKSGGTGPNGYLQNIVNPNTQFQVDPLSIKYYYVQAYANNESTLIDGNFTVTSGPEVQVVIIPDTLRNQWFGDLENGTFAGMSGCTMAGIPTLYDSGLVNSGAFAVAIPPVANVTQFDVVISNPSMNQTTLAAANVYYGY